MTEQELLNDGRTIFRVWWVPQIPCSAFEVEVASYAEGKALEGILAEYDLFQYENNIKPDYSNTGGTQAKHPEVNEGEWFDLDEDEAEEYGWFAA